MIFKNFTELSLDEKKQILEKRNSPEVANFAINKNISLNEHLEFIEKLKFSKDIYLALFDDEEMIGVISFTRIDNDEGFFGLYKITQRKVGEILMNKMLEYGFKNLKLKKIKAEVFEQNTKALKLYEKFGFKITKKHGNLLSIEFAMRGGALNNLIYIFEVSA